jgi:predicted Zn-dependent protease
LGLALVVGVASCSPLYGGRPEKLKNPVQKKRPPEDANAQPVIQYVEECNANFSDDPKKARPQPPMSRQLFEAGEVAFDTADKAKEDQLKVSHLKDAIEKYRNALVKDPYNVPATLKLAVAYDRVLRKACAIAMLKRLSALSNNAKWASEANRNIDSIDANAQWFKGYRKDAMSAVGR